MTPFLQRAETGFNRFSEGAGRLSALLMILLLLNVVYDVVMRYLFNDVSIGMQELEWHLFAMIFLFGVSYALKEDGHVRVDLLYERLSAKRQAMIDIFGVVVLLWPFCILVAYYGLGFAYESWDLGERSGDPGGLPYRWVIKGMISLAFLAMLISSAGFLLRAINRYRAA